MSAPRADLRIRPAFGHSPATLAFWRRWVSRALAREKTPLYLFSADPVAEALQRLESIQVGVPVRHWLSCKTQPLPPLLRWWRRRGRCIEVVSEFEFLAARRVGFRPDQILVNGPAKQRWLPRHAVPGLRVHLDSPLEMERLLPLARRCGWRLGLRVLTGQEYDPEDPSRPTPFGFEPESAVRALRRLLRAGARLESVHVHLRTNVEQPEAYARALGEVAQVCRAARFQPRFVDCGGGLPPPHTASRDGRLYARSNTPTTAAAAYRRALRAFPGVEELWLEHGRFLTAGSGVLVVTVLDRKERRGIRQLICDGGRTLHALVSTWEQHRVVALPARPGRLVPTMVYGPTCMAFDQLGRCHLPAALRPGDRLVWLDAGAYHLPWETRFAHGLGAVLWHAADRLRLVRPAESFSRFWDAWR